MNLDPSVRTLLLAIMRSFPTTGKRMRLRARQLRSVETGSTEMMQVFACETQRAVLEGNGDFARAHMLLVSEMLRTADVKQREYIDVYYVEGLLRGLPERGQRDVWLLMPNNLRELHVQVWGQPQFDTRRR